MLFKKYSEVLLLLLFYSILLIILLGLLLKIKEELVS